MKIEIEILNDLIAIYEKRNSNNSNFKTKIKINLNNKDYNKYFLNRDLFDEAINNLLKKDLIKAKYLKNENIIEYIYLNIEKINEIYILLNKDNEIDLKREKLLNELAKYQDEIIINIKEEVIEKINNNKSIKKYLNDNFIDSLKAIHYLENLDKLTYIRNFSNYIYNDSKKLESLKNTIISVYNNENIFEEKGVIYTTPYLLIKGDCDLYINNYLIKLNLVKTGIQIPIDNLNIIDFKNVTKVTTIENLTTFYDYNDSGLIIYLGGFPSKSQLLVLEKIKEECLNFNHFGDIDYGGFMILSYLRKKLNLNIKAINMNLETLIKYQKYQTKITEESYLKKLESLLKDDLIKDHYEVIKYLIENKIKLEQESLSSS